MMNCLFVFFPRLTMYDVWQWLSRKDACIMHTVINDVYYFGLSLNTMLPAFISDVPELRSM